MNTTTSDIKNRHRALWASGDYDRVATEVIPDLGQALVDAARVRPGDRVLDVAAGSGNAAIPAALAGGAVVASDLTPELLEIGRRHAQEARADITWEVGDAEALPFPDASFDVTLSCVGVMFAPDHAASAAELLRVTRPGGTIALVNWTPSGFIGRMFATMKPFVPASPPGAQPPPLWGDEQHVRALLGDGVHDLQADHRHLTVDTFDSGTRFRDYFKQHYGPTLAVFRSLAGDPDHAAGLDRALAELGDAALEDGSMDWEYLLVTARRAPA